MPRIAQISDLHLRRRQPGTSLNPRNWSRPAGPAFELAVRTALDAGADFIAVTGDLLDVPNLVLDGDDYHRLDLAQWERDVAADYGFLRDVLDATRLPYAVLPGNHDWPRVLRRVFPDQPDEWDLDGYRVVAFRDRDPYAHVPRRMGRERALLERVLTDADARPQIHLQHYVITPPLVTNWPMNYQEAETLRRRLVESGRVVASLSGHEHSGAPDVVEGRCTFSVCEGFVRLPHPYRLVDIDGGRVSWQAMAALPELPLRPAVLLNPFGLIASQPTPEAGPEALTLLPGAAAALVTLSAAGWPLLALWPEPSLALGYQSPDRIMARFDQLDRLLAAFEVHLDAYLFTRGGEVALQPELAPGHNWSPEAFAALAGPQVVDLAQSYFLTAHQPDLAAAGSAGATPLLVGSAGVPNLAAAARLVLARTVSRGAPTMS